MSYPGPDGDDGLSTAAVAATVSAIRPDWTLIDAESLPEGSDFVYGVTVRDSDGRERDAVLKCRRSGGAATARPPERFLAEVDLLALAARETDLPVPDVFGVCETHETPDSVPAPEWVPTPAFLMERMPGEPPSWVPDEESAASQRLLRESGRYLARIHDLRRYDRFGDLIAGPDGEHVAGPDGEPVVPDSRTTWRERLRDVVTSALDDFDDSDADLEADLREYVDDRLTTLDLTAESVLLHGDYRPGNMLAAPDTGEVTAVLDWGAAQAGDPRYELAWVVREFSRQAPAGSPTRERVREAILAAYEDERDQPFEHDDAFERRQSFYLAVTWITELGWFDVWWGGADESIRRRRIETLRENLEELV
ncbi:phosphotransferase family protein [Halosimplex sp. J119]